MKLGIVIGSIREGNVSTRVGAWVAASAQGIFDEVEVLALVDYPLPLFAEAVPPMAHTNRQPTPEVQQWLDAVSACDVLVFVTPEYNHAMPGALKNAIDHFDSQVKNKQIAIVSHGFTGGVRAAENMRQVLESNLGGRVVPETVSIIGPVVEKGIITVEGQLGDGHERLESVLQAALAALKA